jgi:rRNA-processing protein FCF1
MATANVALFQTLNGKNRMNDGNIEVVQSRLAKPEAADHDLRTSVARGLDKARASYTAAMAEAAAALMSSMPWTESGDDDPSSVLIEAARTQGRVVVVIVTKDADFVAHVEDVLRAGQRVIVVASTHTGLAGILAARTINGGLLQLVQMTDLERCIIDETKRYNIFLNGPPYANIAGL